MVTINLLPWREYTRVYQQKKLKIILLMSAAISSFFLLLMHALIAKQIDHAQSHIESLQNEVNQYGLFEQRLQKKQQNAALIAQLLSKGSIPKKLFGSFNEKNTTASCFTTIARTNNTIRFQGRTRSAADLTSFISHWKAAQLFTEIKVEQLEQKENGMIFTLQAIENEL